MNDLIKRFKESKFLEELVETYDPLMISLSGSCSLGVHTETSDIDLSILVDKPVDFIGERKIFYRVGRREINIFVETPEELFLRNEKRTGAFAYINNPYEPLYKKDYIFLETLDTVKDDLMEFTINLYYQALDQKIDNLINDEDTFIKAKQDKRFYILLYMYHLKVSGAVSEEALKEIRFVKDFNKGTNWQAYRKILLPALSYIKAYVKENNYDEHKVNNLVKRFRTILLARA